MPKSNGGLRLYINYKVFNNIIVKNSYPLPLIRELQDKLQRKKFFTKFNILGAFNQIRMKKGDKWKIAFHTRQGLYKYLIMPFRLTNAPAIFQAFINNILKEYLDDFVLVYINDILIYLDTIEEYIVYIRKVLVKLQKVGLYLKLLKYNFY